MSPNHESGRRCFDLEGHCYTLHLRFVLRHFATSTPIPLKYTILSCTHVSSYPPLTQLYRTLRLCFTNCPFTAVRHLTMPLHLLLPYFSVFCQLLFTRGFVEVALPNLFDIDIRYFVEISRLAIRASSTLSSNLPVKSILNPTLSNRWVPNTCQNRPPQYQSKSAAFPDTRTEPFRKICSTFRVVGSKKKKSASTARLLTQFVCRHIVRVGRTIFDHILGKSTRRAQPQHTSGSSELFVWSYSHLFLKISALAIPNTHIHVRDHSQWPAVT